MSKASRQPLAISMGEPAGLGPDLILQIYARRQSLGLPPFVVYGQRDFFAARARRLGLDLPLSSVEVTDAAATFKQSMPIVEIAGTVGDNPGEPTPVSGGLVMEAIARATHDVMRGAARGLVTAPIAKSVLYGAGFRHPGHTEYLAELCAQDGVPRLPVMMLAHEEFRAVPVTIHVPLSAVPTLLTSRLLDQTLRIVHHDLRTRFGVLRPKIAVSGLNPHAGESGTIGLEDLAVIKPVIEGMRHDDMDVVGPLPADTLFYPEHWRQYDAVVAMYHDQALIPIKTIAFDSAVNVTLGLPIVRTSPDHGTAFDLAGTGKGSWTSFVAAIRMADRMTDGSF